MSERTEPGNLVVMRAFTIASDRGRRCQPVDLLSALAEVDGAIGSILRSADGSPMFPDSASIPGLRGGTSSYLTRQTLGAAQDLATSRGETMAPAHLLLAVIDQADPEVTYAFTDAGVDPNEARTVALGLLGAPSGLPRLVMPPLVATGTLDRPPLEVSSLDSGAWAVLRWRQDHLPLAGLRRRWQWNALSHLEMRAALRVAEQFHVDEDQRYSLLNHHHDRVEALAHQAHPELVETREQLRQRHQAGPYMRVVSRPRRFWERRVPGFMIGWPTWFANRRVGLRNKYFRLVTAPNYLHQPRPPRIPAP